MHPGPLPLQKRSKSRVTGLANIIIMKSCPVPSIVYILTASLLVVAFGVYSCPALNEDFEDGSIEPWEDVSGKWNVEDISTTDESPAPLLPPYMDETSNKYLRVVHGNESEYGFGPAVLRSPPFIVSSDVVVTFSFWIRSLLPHFNNLELYYRSQGKEIPLVKNLYKYSNENNFSWETKSANISISGPTEIKLIFYGYCGFDSLDSIAIDNIRVIEQDISQTTVSSSTTKTASSTIMTTTSEARPTPNATESPAYPCGGNFINVDSGTIASPSYPGYYGFNIECRYVIEVPDDEEHVIMLHFNDFGVDIDEEYASLTIYDGHTEESEYILRAYPGFDENDKKPIWSSGTKMLVVFISQSEDKTRQGWLADYEAKKGGEDNDKAHQLHET